MTLGMRGLNKRRLYTGDMKVVGGVLKVKDLSRDRSAGREEGGSGLVKSKDAKRHLIEIHYFEQKHSAW